MSDRCVVKKRPLYAIGDVHGDVERLLKLLVAHDIIETSDGFEWKKENAIVLLMGDVLDARSVIEGFGDMSFQGTTSDMWLLEFLMVASKKAASKGSAIYALMGEHEYKNICHDFSSASPYHARDITTRASYFSPNGNGYRAICSHYLTSIVYNRNLYSHAGLPLRMTDDQKSLVNKRVSAQMLSPDMLDTVGEFVSHNDYIRAPSVDDQECLNTMLRRRGADRMVVGHYFTQGNGILSSWNDKVVYTDVGLSKAYMPTSTRLTSTILYDDGSGQLKILDLSGACHEIPRADEGREMTDEN